jgi:hypothetical protein
MPYKRDVIQYFFYFATFSMKKNNLKFKTVKVEGFHPRSRLRSAVCRDTTVSVKIKKLHFTIFSMYYYYITPFPITIRKTVS